MVSFLGNLKSDGYFKDYKGNPTSKIIDVDGNFVKGKLLSDFTFYAQSEQWDIEYHKSEVKKEQLRQIYKMTALDKLLRRIRIELQTGGYFRTSPGDTVRYLVEYMDKELGVGLRRSQLEQFIRLYTNLNNYSNLWLNCGWSPRDLSRYMGGGKPQSISIGPNMKKMFESGEMDRAEFEKKMKELGIEITE